MLIAAFLCIAPAPASARDIGNCLVCHRYPGLSAVNDSGSLRLFFVDEAVWGASVHKKVGCDGCHTDIDRLPHDPAVKVDCLQECHITEPSSEELFSHANAADELRVSVHSPLNEDGTEKPYPEDYPTCKNCHENPGYRPLSFYKTVQPGVSEVAIGRCRVCHESDEFINTYYQHITSRLHPLRSPSEIGDMCSHCHDDPELIERHDLTARAVVTYEATLHGKAASLDNTNVPDCLDCHVTIGESVHTMLSHRDVDSPVYRSNMGAVCSQEACHPNVNDRALSYQLHAEINTESNSVLLFFTMFFHVLAGGTLIPLYGVILLDLLRRHIPEAVFTIRRK